VVAWGVGGIEAEAVMLGQPIYMLTPDVIGVKMTGSLPEGARLEKPTLDVLRGIFQAADQAADAFGAEAARVSFAYSKRGLRIDATSYRA
jgi:hypothetical protein